MSEEKVKRKWISAEAYDINKQTILYSAEIKDRTKGALCPEARTGLANKENG